MEWKLSSALIPYEEAIALMEERAQAIYEGKASELVWLLEHPPLYTAGTGANAADLLDARFPVHQTGRGGQYTYHGPGQRIAYVMLNLNKRGQDLRRYVQNLEAWLIQTLAAYGVKGEIREGRVGVWVQMDKPRSSRGGVLYDDPAKRGGAERGRNAPLIGEAKIAAIGVRVRKWVTYHGISLNVSPDLGHYAGIVPCGVREHGITSLAALGVEASMQDVDAQLQKSFGEIFKYKGGRP